VSDSQGSAVMGENWFVYFAVETTGVRSTNGAQ
jgi:hypothetical protein